jgi:formate--tetrahydrofolate ligase
MARTALDDIAAKLEIPEAAIDPRGTQAIKVDPTAITADRKGRVVLVTAMTPTPAGEGKTTTSIGLVDALNKRGVRAVAALREPSLGPLFGLKGGAIGGGQSKVQPSDQINMHFTGDIHAVTSAHNLLSALLDNHMYAKNEPIIPPENVTWGRVMDMNERALRKCKIGFATKRGPHRDERFDITAASEVMAVLCMSRDVEDLRARLDRIVVGTTEDGTPVTAKDLKAGGAMAAILLDAATPNLVRTLEDSPVFVHGGPFANIAQGTSTLIQTNLCRKLADVVITEAGFAFDLGGFKFCDIKCREGGFKPAQVVLVTTVRALRYHGGADHEAGPNLEAVTKGLENVGAHMDAMERLGLPKPIVSINRFPDDSPEEIDALKKFVNGLGGEAVEGDYFARGGDGALDLADALMGRLEKAKDDSPDFKHPYELSDPIEKKIEGIAKTVLGAQGVELTDDARADLQVIERMGLGDRPVCLAKTHLSISDDKTVQGRPAPYTMTVTGLRPAAGAGFVVALCGPILTMPGLPKIPAAKDVDIQRNSDGRWEIVGLR